MTNFKNIDFKISERTMKDLQKLEAKMDTYQPVKDSDFVKAYKELMKRVTFETKSAVEHIVKFYEDKVQKKNDLPIVYTFDKCKGKEVILDHLKIALDFHPDFEGSKLREFLFKQQKKVIAEVNKRYEEDFPTVALKYDAKDELDARKNASIIREFLFSDVEFINMAFKRYNNRVSDKEIAKWLKEQDIEVIRVYTGKEDNKKNIAYYFVNLDEDMYDYNVYVLNIEKDQITLHYFVAFMHNFQTVELDRLNKGNKMDKEPNVNIEKALAVVNNTPKDFTLEKETGDKVKKFGSQLKKDYKLGVEITDYITDIVKRKGSSESKENKINKEVLKVGGFVEDVDNNVVTLSILGKNTVKNVRVKVNKTTTSVKLIDIMQVKNVKSRKLKSNVKYNMTDFDKGVSDIEVFIENKNYIDSFSIELIDVKKAKRKDVDSNKKFALKVWNEKKVEYYESRKEAMEQLVKFIERVA